ncbi:MAG: flagellar motor switch protein FliM [Marinicaulis sp.]|nr:flagellar motor switch protein FliM [Marinicaulis sp.]
MSEIDFENEMPDEDLRAPETAAPEAAEDVEWNDDIDSDEISELLGFDLSAEEGEDRSGLKALINSAIVSNRRLPMLDVIFDRAARHMTTSLRQMTNDNVEVVLDDIGSTRFGDFIQGVSLPSVIGVLKSDALDNYCLIAIDSELVFSVVDLLLGGRRGHGALSIEDRGFTKIELGLVEQIITLMAEDLTTAFSAIADIKFTLDRIETTPRFAAIAQDASVSSLAKFRVDMEDRGGRAAILTPHATLEPIYKLLLSEFISDARGGDTAWRADLEKEIAAATIDLKVVLAERSISISELADLTAGSTIRFSAAQKITAEIRSGETVVATGSVGRSGDNIAIRLDDDGVDETEPQGISDEAAA